MKTTFQASPKGKRSGLVVASNGERQLSVAVLPKFWRDGTPKSYSISWAESTQQLSIFLFEGDTCSVTHKKDDLHLFEKVFSSMTSQPAIQNNYESDPEELSVPLITPIAQTIPNKYRTSEKFDGTVEHLITLFDIAERSRILTRPKETLLAEPVHARLLYPLLHILFIQEVEKVFNNVRRGYIPQEDSISAIRGRVIERSLLEHQATGVPVLKCVFDEFTEATELLGVIASTLDIVATGTYSSNALIGKDKLADSRVRAVRIRRALTNVPSIPISSAISIGKRITLDRFSFNWSEALSLALVILQGFEYHPRKPIDSRLVAFEIDIPTDKLWEQIVRDACSTRHIRSSTQYNIINFNSKAPSFKVPAPWDNPNGSSLLPSRPDIIVRNDQTLWCLDAKYKYLSNSPNREDLYQIFAYSHLIQFNSSINDNKEDKVSHAALIYPSSENSSVKDILWRQPLTQESIPLYLIQLRFPSSKDILNKTTWAKYLSELGIKLAKIFIDQAKPSVENMSKIKI